MEAFGKSDHEFLGSEFDWVAWDQEGNLGYFSTAGEGWIPESILAKPEAFWDSLDTIMTLPVVGNPESTFHGNHAIDDWLNVAARGLYAFDWNRGTDRYELVARPKARVCDESVRRIKFLSSISILPCLFRTDFAFRGPTA
jgi:hypothetical protein